MVNLSRFLPGVVLLPLATFAQITIHAEQPVLANYMRARAQEVYLGHNQKDLHRANTPSGLAFAQAEAFIKAVGSTPVDITIGETHDESTAPAYMLGGWDLVPYGAHLCFLLLPTVDEPNSLYCVADGQRIWELTSNSGLDARAAIGWYFAKTAVPREQKGKVLTYVLSKLPNRPGKLLGFLRTLGDIDAVQASCERDINAGMKTFLAEQKAKYTKHLCQFDPKYLYYVQAFSADWIEIERVRICERRITREAQGHGENCDWTKQEVFGP